MPQTHGVCLLYVSEHQNQPCIWFRCRMRSRRLHFILQFVLYRMFPALTREYVSVSARSLPLSTLELSMNQILS